MDGWTYVSADRQRYMNRQKDIQTDIRDLMGEKTGDTTYVHYGKLEQGKF